MRNKRNNRRWLSCLLSLTVAAGCLAEPAWIVRAEEFTQGKAVENEEALQNEELLQDEKRIQNEELFQNEEQLQMEEQFQDGEWLQSEEAVQNGEPELAEPLAEPDYIFSGNMVRNPSFDEEQGWEFNGGGYASNNGHHGRGDKHFYLDGGGAYSMSQKFRVPYTGYYNAGLWIAAAGEGGKIKAADLTTGESQECVLADDGAYKEYHLEIWLNKGDEVELSVSGAESCWWVNGDDISLEYNYQKFAELAVNPNFALGDTVWTKAGAATVSAGGATLSAAGDSISQEIYIPQNGPYYAEVSLENANGAKVVFAGKESEAVTGTLPVKVEVAGLKQGERKELKISGPATVKSVSVKVNESAISNELPSASDVAVKVDCATGLTLEGSYIYADKNDYSEGSSECQWFLADTKDGAYQPLEGETNRNLTVKKEWQDKFLKFQVTPVNMYGKKGAAVQSTAAGPVDSNLIENPGFESGGSKWTRMFISTQDAYEGNNRGIVIAGRTASQSVTAPEAAYYNLSGYVRYDGTAQGAVSIEDEAGNELGNAQVIGAEGWKRIEIKDIPLAEGQKAKIVLKGAEKNYYIDALSLKRDKEAGMPAFDKNVINFTTVPEAFKTSINVKEQAIRLEYLYGTDVSKAAIGELEVSPGASASLKSGDTLNLSGNNVVTMVVTGSDGSKSEWKIQAAIKDKKVAMSSSNKDLESNFNWAANKMDQFVMSGQKGPVNVSENGGGEEGVKDYIPSYWAGYYDRTAFYGRDFVHQATGAQIAGLAEENYSMFEAFAKECTEARKWYTVWALNFDGSVYGLDYNNENSFVREVPAQFELVEKAYKQYLWSGDRRYIEDETLWNFYTNVMTKYVESHDENGNGVAQEVGTGIFAGSCTYNERGRRVIEAGDAIGSQYQATLAYAGMLKARGEEAASQEWYQKAADLKKYFNEEWSVTDGDMDSQYVCAWGPNGERYSDFSKETSWFIPLKMITDPGERNDAYIDFLLENLGEGIGTSETAPSNIEAYTYIPDMLFLYNRKDDAWKWMQYITSIKDEPHERAAQGTNGDYPEISYTYVSHVIEGMMGVEPNAGMNFVATSPRLPSAVNDMEVKYMQIGGYELDLAHKGNTESALTNNGQKAITWEARFYGNHDRIKIGNEMLPAQKKEINGVTVSYATVEVQPGASVSAKVATQGEWESSVRVKNVEDLISKIGTVTVNSKAAIEAARAAYEALSAEEKALVKNLETLKAAEAKYEELTKQDQGQNQTVKTDISKAVIKTIPTQYYKGKALTPAVGVTYGGKALVKDKDYKAVYSNNKNIGTAKVVISGIGDYTGTVTKTFKITVKKNAVYTVGNYKYKVLTAKTNGKGTVAVTGVKSKSVKNKLKKIQVASSVKIGGKKFLVTQIGASAFSGCKKASSAVIDVNVTKIGAKAFYNCGKLKNITIKSKKLKSVGKNALKNISSKAKIKVPKNKLKTYKKLLKSKGQKKSVKIVS